MTFSTYPPYWRDAYALEFKNVTWSQVIGFVVGVIIIIGVVVYVFR